MTKDEEEKAITEEEINKLIVKYRVVHNDIHSNNIMRRDNGDYVLLDFGLAFDGFNAVRSSIKKAGVMEFMAPEKWDAKLEEKDLTPQLDIYGFGVVLYEYLTGQVPFLFEGKTATDRLKLMDRIKNSPDSKSVVPSIFEARARAFRDKFQQDYEKDYPDWLEEVIMKCLENNPKNRYADGKELYEDVKKHMKEWNPSAKEIEKLKNEVEKLEKKVEELEKNISQLAQDNESLEKEKKRLEDNLQKAEKVIKKLEVEIKRLQGHLGPDIIPIGGNGIIKELKEKLGKAKHEISSLALSVDSLRKENHELEQENVLLLKKRLILRIVCAIFGLALLLGVVYMWRLSRNQKKIDYLEMEIEEKELQLTIKDGLLNQKSDSITMLGNELENALFLRTHPELVGRRIVGKVAKKGGNIFLMEQLDSICVLKAYSRKGSTFEETEVFKTKTGLFSVLPSVRYDCWTSSHPYGEYFVFNKEDNALYVPMLVFGQGGKIYGSDRYIVYRFDGDKFEHKGYDGAFWIHPTLREYKALVGIFKSVDYQIRLDEMAKGYRYAVWKRNADMASEPEMVLEGNLVGAGKFLFENGSYGYHIAIDSTATILTVTKGDETLRQENMETVVKRDENCWETGGN